MIANGLIEQLVQKTDDGSIGLSITVQRSNIYGFAVSVTVTNGDEKIERSRLVSEDDLYPGRLIVEAYEIMQDIFIEETLK